MQVPTTLIMRPSLCFYCPQPPTLQCLLGPHEGILCCAAHLTDAQRDTDAHMARMNMVRLGDAKTDPNLERLLAGLETTFKIRRSSGLIEPGWSLLNDIQLWNYFRKYDGQWYLSAMKIEENGDRNRRQIPLSMFLEPELELPGVSAADIFAGIAALDAGFYNEALASQEILATAGAVISEQIDAPNSGIVSAIINGKECRVFI